MSRTEQLMSCLSLLLKRVDHWTRQVYPVLCWNRDSYVARAARSLASGRPRCRPVTLPPNRAICTGAPDLARRYVTRCCARHHRSIVVLCNRVKSRRPTPPGWQVRWRTWYATLNRPPSRSSPWSLGGRSGRHQFPGSEPDGVGNFSSFGAAGSGCIPCSSSIVVYRSLTLAITRRIGLIRPQGGQQFLRSLAAWPLVAL